MAVSRLQFSVCSHFSFVTGENSGLDREEFKRALQRESTVEQWASTLPLPQLLASCLPRQDALDSNPLRVRIWAYQF
jgi:hypothetical protein